MAPGVNKARFVAYLAIAMTALIFSTPLSAKANDKAPTKCAVGRGHVMTANSQAVLYRAPEHFEHLIVYGCTFEKHRSYQLGYFPDEGTCSSSGCIGVQHEVLAGSLVAYEFFSIGGGGGTFLVIVRDLRNGHVVYRVPTGTPRPQNASSVVGAGSTVTIVLKTDGSVAWITERPHGEATEYQVHALDKTGNRLLATGTDIDPQSLALAGSTLYWTQGDEPFSTLLK